jgi:hypothetical protein
MATGLIGEKAGSQALDPRQPQRSRPRQPQRPRPGQRPGRPGEPQRLRPAGRPGPADGRATAPEARTAPAGRRVTGALPRARSRTPFILLLVGLLGGGLVCLLLINTTLAEGSFRITAMQQKNAALTQQEQALQQETAQLEAPAWIAARARQLGMQPVGRLRFINLKDGRIYNQPARVPGVAAVPGYTP